MENLKNIGVVFFWVGSVGAALTSSVMNEVETKWKVKICEYFILMFLIMILLSVPLIIIGGWNEPNKGEQQYEPVRIR